MSNFLGENLLNNIQLQFINKINDGFMEVQGYSTQVFYVLAALEIALFGIAWVIKQDESLSLLILKIFKISFVFFIISNFPYLMQALIDGFTKVGFTIASEKASIFLFSPGKIWLVGYESGMSMLKIAVQYGSFNMGMMLIYLILGFGTLFFFLLIGIQIVLSIVFFYIVAIATLLLLPFGIIKPMENFFYKGIQLIFKAGIRVFVVIIVLGVAFAILKTLQVKNVSINTQLDKPMALFFTSFIFCVLIYKLPSLVSEVVGKIGGDIFAGMNSNSTSSPSVSVSAPSSPSGANYPVSGSNYSAQSGGGYGNVGVSSVGAASSNISSVNNVSNSQSAGNPLQSGGLSSQGSSDVLKDLKKSAAINKSISQKTLKSLKSNKK